MVINAEMQNLRGLLADRRHALVQTLCAAVAEKRMIEPGFLRLLADLHTTIAAVNAQLIELEGGA